MATIRHLGSRDDEAAIGQVLLQVAKGEALRDAELVGAAYSEDADWTGPDGERRQGRREILETLRERFAHPGRGAERETTARPQVKITFLGPDAAWVRSVHGVHRLLVMRRDEGQWHIAAELAAP